MKLHTDFQYDPNTGITHVSVTVSGRLRQMSEAGDAANEAVKVVSDGSATRRATSGEIDGKRFVVKVTYLVNGIPNTNGT